MQWLIDLIAEKILQNMQGMILIWSGAVVDIPSGWSLCDGNNGTPDLRDRFLVGAGSTFSPDDTGGSLTHTHDFLGDGHSHSIKAGKEIAPGPNYNSDTDQNSSTGTTDASIALRPPYYALAYIIKL